MTDEAIVLPWGAERRERELADSMEHADQMTSGEPDDDEEPEIVDAPDPVATLNEHGVATFVDQPTAVIIPAGAKLPDPTAEWSFAVRGGASPDGSPIVIMDVFTGHGPLSFGAPPGYFMQMAQMLGMAATQLQQAADAVADIAVAPDLNDPNVQEYMRRMAATGGIPQPRR